MAASWLQETSWQDLHFLFLSCPRCVMPAPRLMVRPVLLLNDFLRISKHFVRANCCYRASYRWFTSWKVVYIKDIYMCKVTVPFHWIVSVYSHAISLPQGYFLRQCILVTTLTFYNSFLTPVTLVRPLQGCGVNDTLWIPYKWQVWADVGRWGGWTPPTTVCMGKTPPPCHTLCSWYRKHC